MTSRRERRHRKRFTANKNRRSKKIDFDDFRAKSKTFNQFTWGLLVFGIIALAVGLYQIIYLPIRLGTNIRYQQSIVSNGSIKLILGFFCTCAAIYRFHKKNKIMKDVAELEKEEDI